MNQRALQSSLAELKDDLWEGNQTTRFFRSCLQPESDSVIDANLESFRKLKREMHLLWPETGVYLSHPLEAMVAMAMRWDLNPVFRLQVALQKGTSSRILIIRRGRLGVAWKARREIRLSVAQYKEHVDFHLTYLDQGDGTANDIYPKLQNLEDDIIDGIYATLRGEPIQHWYTVVKLGTKPSIMEKWQRSLNPEGNPYGNWDGTNWVFVEDDRTLFHVENLLGNHTAKDLDMGLSWVFIKSHLWAVTGQHHFMIPDEDPTKKELACLEYVNSRFGLLTFARHIGRRYPTQKQRDDVSGYMHLVKDRVRSFLETASWIDKRVRDEAKTKLDDMELHGLPADVFFVPSERTKLYSGFPSMSKYFTSNLMEVSSKYQKLQMDPLYQDLYDKHMVYQHYPAAYWYPLNRVEVAMVALEPPLFYFNATYAINFAGLGSMVAKEIVKSFDEQGTRVDQRGEFAQWWGASNAYEYSQKVNCILNTAAGNDSRTGHQHIALFPAIPALEATFDAYKEAVKIDHRKIKDFKIVGLTQYTDDQIFFMSYCYWMCSGTGDVDRDQCNVPLKHFDAFAEVFKCPEGSAMNPSTKCKFFLS
ncbi:neprilysin-4-like isoform X2 [Haemaphysalis longicornis]